MALGGAPRHFAWRTWRLVTLTFHLRGRRGTGDIDLPFAWQAWHLVTLAFHLRGRRGTCGTGLALVARLGALGRPWRCATLRGQHGTWCHLRGRRGAWPSICVAGVAFGDIDLSFAWQARHLWHWAGRVALRHTPSFTHHCVTHTIFHTHHLSPTIFHTQLCHTPFLTHRFVTHHLSHTIFHHTIFHIQLCHTHTHTIFHHTIFHKPLCHTPSFTHNFVTRSLSRTTFTHPIFHTQLCHTHHLSLSHTIFHIQLCHTLSFTHNFRTPHLSHTTLSYTPSFFVTHHLSHTTLSHATFFLHVDPSTPPLSSLPRPATTFAAHYWKKLTCGVIRSFNFGKARNWHQTPNLAWRRRKFQRKEPYRRGVLLRCMDGRANPLLDPMML